MNKKDFQTLQIVDIDDLAYKMIQDATNAKCSTSVLFFEDAKNLAKALMTAPEVTVGSIEISEPLFNGYDDEYYVSLFCDSEDEAYELFVEPALINDKNNKYGRLYLSDISDCLYIMDDVSKDVYEYVTADEVYIVVDANNKLSRLIDEFLNAEFECSLTSFTRKYR